MSCHKNPISLSVCRPFLIAVFQETLHCMQTTSTYLTEQYRLNFFQFLCLSHRSALFSLSFLLCYSVLLPLIYLHPSSVYFCIFLSLSPSLSSFFASVSCFLLGQEQIWFITFLMLFVIAWHSQHVKSKSCFRAVVCAWCTGISISPLRVLSSCKQFSFIHADYKHLISLQLKDLLI